MKLPKKIKQINSSFRDPSGTVFSQNGLIYRTLNYNYKNNYDYLISSGLYDRLTKLDYLVSHQEIKFQSDNNNIYKVIKPDKIPFISYPYEWTFSELKDAALLTLAIELEALKHGMWLKDSSGFNIQFINGKPILIDTLSFEKYQENIPWIAYGQFCRHFLSPLVLMAYKNLNFNQRMRINLDGISVETASKLLPYKSYFNPSVFIHIHMHAKSIKHYADKRVLNRKVKHSLIAHRGLINNLINIIKSLKRESKDTQWFDYYDFSSYTPSAFKSKENIFKKFLKVTDAKDLWDIGANTGYFSRISAGLGINTIAFDSDPAAIEKLYLDCKNRNENRILPLFMDITNPSPDIGWGNSERMSLISRGPASAVSFLALVHHLVISQNIPLEKIAEMLAKICQWLIIEFVPKDDTMVKKLLLNRKDIYTQYSQSQFEISFSKHFNQIQKKNITSSKRVMYLYRNKRSIR